MALHGEMEQKIRIRILEDFKDGKYSVLVSTGVLGRGIDLPSCQQVIVFDFPCSVDEYVHQVRSVMSHLLNYYHSVMICRISHRLGDVLDLALAAQLSHLSTTLANVLTHTYPLIYVVPHPLIYVVPHPLIYVVPHPLIYVVPHPLIYVVPHPLIRFVCKTFEYTSANRCTVTMATEEFTSHCKETTTFSNL